MKNMLLISIISVVVMIILVIILGLYPAYLKEKIIINISLNYKKISFHDRIVCGLKNLENKIKGGVLTEIAEFPWLIALEYTSNGSPAGIRCGGTLINNRYVLTAAHCIDDQELNLNNVRLGEWNITTDPDCNAELIGDCADPIHIIGIEKIIPHPYYQKTSGENDIGLVKLERDVTYTNYIRPICLPNPDSPFPEIGTNLIVVGWGENNQGSTISDVPLKVTIPVTNNNCKNKQYKDINGNQLCAGGKLGKSIGKADSGGPLMRLQEDPLKRRFQWYQEGVVAYDRGIRRPSTYTRVSRYIKWIISNVKD